MEVRRLAGGRLCEDRVRSDFRSFPRLPESSDWFIPVWFWGESQDRGQRHPDRRPGNSDGSPGNSTPRSATEGSNPRKAPTSLANLWKSPPLRSQMKGKLNAIVRPVRTTRSVISSRKANGTPNLRMPTGAKKPNTAKKTRWGRTPPRSFIASVWRYSPNSTGSFSENRCFG